MNNVPQDPTPASTTRTGTAGFPPYTGVAMIISGGATALGGLPAGATAAATFISLALAWMIIRSLRR